MGAVANLAPDLFAGILAQVPFVDPLTTILDPSLPLTVTEWDEWGNPLADSDVYAYMKSYSPYENVAAGQLSGDTGHDIAQRHPGVLRRAGEMGCGASAHQDRWQSGVVEDPDERRSRRNQRSLRALEGNRIPVRVVASSRVDEAAETRRLRSKAIELAASTRPSR